MTTSLNLHLPVLSSSEVAFAPKSTTTQLDNNNQFANTLKAAQQSQQEPQQPPRSDESSSDTQSVKEKDASAQTNSSQSTAEAATEPTAATDVDHTDSTETAASQAQVPTEAMAGLMQAPIQKTDVLPPLDSALDTNPMDPALEAKALDPKLLRLSNQRSEPVAHEQLNAQASKLNAQPTAASSQPLSAAVVAALPRHSDAARTATNFAQFSNKPTGMVSATPVKNVRVQPTIAKTDISEPQEFMKHLNQSLAVAGQIQARHLESAQTNPSYMTSGSQELIGSMLATPGQSTMGLSNQAINHQNAATQFYTIDVPFNHEGWSKAMSQQVIHFMRNSALGEQVAQMRLDPPELGPLRVELRIDEAGMAQAIFSSANASVRQTLEQALPELHRSLGSAGLTLSHAGVDDQANSNFFQQNDEPSQPHRFTNSTGQSTHDINTTQELPRLQSHEGLINTFA